MTECTIIYSILLQYEHVPTSTPVLDTCDKRLFFKIHHDHIRCVHAETKSEICCTINCVWGCCLLYRTTVRSSVAYLRVAHWKRKLQICAFLHVFPRSATLTLHRSSDWCITIYRRFHTRTHTDGFLLTRPCQERRAQKSAHFLSEILHLLQNRSVVTQQQCASLQLYCTNILTSCVCDLC